MNLCYRKRAALYSVGQKGCTFHQGGAIASLNTYIVEICSRLVVAGRLERSLGAFWAWSKHCFVRAFFRRRNKDELGCCGLPTRDRRYHVAQRTHKAFQVRGHIHQPRKKAEVSYHTLCLVQLHLQCLNIQAINSISVPHCAGVLVL